MKRVIKGVGAAVLLTFAAPVFAEETVEMRGGMTFTRCEKSGDSTENCNVSVESGLPVKIDLVENDGFLYGEHEFTSESDGFKFTAIVRVSKYTAFGNSQYSIVVSLDSMKGDDGAAVTHQSLGNIYVSDMTKLNAVIFDGAMVETSNVKLFPKVIIGPKDDYLF